MKILLVKSGALGDVLMTTSIIESIKNEYPNSQLYYLVGEEASKALFNNPRLTDIIVFDDNILLKRKIFKFLKIAMVLRKHSFDIAFVYHSNPIMHLLLKISNVKTRVGFSSRLPFLLNKGKFAKDFNTSSPYKRNYQLTKMGIPNISFCSPKLYPTQNLFAIERSLHGDKYKIAFSVGGGQNVVTNTPLKRWPSSSFLELAYLINKNYQSDIFFIGLRNEFNSSDDEIARAGAINLLGKLSYDELISLVSNVDLIVTNDTSTLHIAQALGTPAIALFGPTLAKNYIYPGCNSVSTIQSAFPCSPCEDSRGRLNEVCSKPLCMSAIDVHAVFSAIKNILE